MPLSQDDAAIEALFSRRTGDIRPGLERVRKAWGAIGRPAANIPTIIVGGTNGKGTVCAYTFHLLALMGLRVGLYSSPHLCHFRERIQLSDRLIQDSDIIAALEKLRTLLDSNTYGSLSFFEIATLLGFLIFEENGTEANVVEVGMGGRWDATNLLDADLAAIVSIGLDHTTHLGDSLEAIAGEKAPIARRGGRLFWGGVSSGGSSESEVKVREVLQTYCEQKDIRFLTRGRDFHLEESGLIFWIDCEGQLIQKKIPDYFTHCAPFQRQNFALAATLVHRFFFAVTGAFRPLGSITDIDIFHRRFDGAWGQFGTEQAPMGPTVLGRYQKLEVKHCVTGGISSLKRDLLLDVCHNPDGVLALKEALKSEGLILPGTCPGLVSILGDKDVDGILDLLQGFLDPIVLFRIPNDRSFREKELAERHRGLLFFESFQGAFEFALKHWSGQCPVEKKSQPWVVCGSLAAVGEVLSVFQAVPQNFLPSQKLSGVWNSVAID